MACRDTLPSDTSFLLEYLEQLPYESDSDGDKFEGYLGPDDGPVIIRAIDYTGYEDQELFFFLFYNSFVIKDREYMYIATKANTRHDPIYKIK